jgi:hypothetical protein
MRSIIPILAFMVVVFTTSFSQERYIIWHDGELDILLENKDAGLTRAEGTSIANSSLLVVEDPSKVKLSNNGSEAVKVKVLALGAGKASLWQNLGPETITSLQDIIQNEEPNGVLGADATLWDHITGFYGSTLDDDRQKLRASIQEQMKKRAASEKASIKKVNGVKFNSPGWVELSGPEDLDISWTSRYPIASVCLRLIGQAEPVFKVDDLGYYRIQYSGLNRSIREKILRNRRYEIQVTVKDESGKEKMATTRFFIKKSLDFDPAMGREFALDQLNFKWESQYPVTEVMFQDAENKDTLYYVDQADVITNIHQFPSDGAKKNRYQLDLADFSSGTLAQVKRGFNYDLVVAISDERGAKRLFSKRYYCLSTEETIMKALGEDRESYRKLMEFAATVQEMPPVASSNEELPASEEEAVAQTEVLPEPVKEQKVVEEAKVVEEEKVSLPQEDELIEKQAVQQGDDNPVFFYSFDQPLITDQSGNNFNAMGSVLTTDRKGQANQAYGFDGQQDFIALPTNDQFVFSEQTPFTLSYWYKADQPEASLSQIYQEAGKEGSFFLDVKLSNGQLMVWCCAKDISCETLFGKRPEMEEWHHLAITFDASSQLKLFMDGELIRSRAITLDIADEQPCAILFGKDQAGQNFLSGGMDDIVLFKKALSAEEIKKLAK